METTGLVCNAIKTGDFQHVSPLLKLCSLVDIRRSPRGRSNLPCSPFAMASKKILICLLIASVLAIQMTSIEGNRLYDEYLQELRNEGKEYKRGCKDNLRSEFCEKFRNKCNGDFSSAYMKANCAYTCHACKK